MGTAAGAAALLFPPWRFGRITLPYRPQWPPLSSPVRGLTGYTPLSFTLDAPGLDSETAQAIQAKIREEVGAGDTVQQAEQLATALGQLRIDAGRLLWTLGIIAAITGVAVVLVRDRPGTDGRSQSA